MFITTLLVKYHALTSQTQKELATLTDTDGMFLLATRLQCQSDQMERLIHFGINHLTTPHTTNHVGNSLEHLSNTSGHLTSLAVEISQETSSM